MDTNILQGVMDVATPAPESAPSEVTVQSVGSVTVTCTNPASGAAILSRTQSIPFVFSGTTVAHISTRIGNFPPEEVTVRFGAGTPVYGTISREPNAQGTFPWTCAVNLPVLATSVLVTVGARFEVSDGVYASDAVSLTLNPDITPPTLTIPPPPNPLPVSIPIGTLADISINGTAGDAGGTGVSSVQMKVDSGAFAPASPDTPEWSNWTAHARFTIGLNITTGEQHTLAFDAIDKSNNHWNWSQPAPLTLRVIDSPPLLGLGTVNGKTPLYISNPPGYYIGVTATAQGATITVLGSASTLNASVPGQGVGVGISSVTWAVEGGGTGTATLQGTADARSWTWTAASIPIPLDPIDDKRTVTFTCQNSNGTRTTALLTVTLENSFSSPDPDTLSSLSYLYDLLRFAREIPRITVSGQAATNIAPTASVTVSSTYSAAYDGPKATDGIVGVNGSGEWASSGQQNPWIKLTWESPRIINRIRLYDRANTTDNANGGTLTFSDGSSIPVSGIPTNGTMKEQTFSPKTITWVKFQVESGTGPNVGLSEFEVYTQMAAPTAADLSSELRQPFDDLTVLSNKERGIEPVRQIRLCAEVLRAYLLPMVTAAPEYSRTAYNTLLNQIGTSYEELRLARSYLPVPQSTEPPVQRRNLADRLGIDLGTARPDPLDRLLLDPDAAPAQSNAVTEQLLEQLFGLMDTTRDVLSDCAKLGDTQNQITRWNLHGVAWERNTDLNGFIHVSLTKPSASAYQVTLYRDAARTSVVASGQSASAAGAVSLQPQNNSGLAGDFIINYTANSSAISLAAVPTFLSWQLAHLRTNWKNEDYPDIPPADISPIVDPDLLIPGDFKNRFSTDAAYNLYTTRGSTVQGWFNALKTLREQAASAGAGLDAVLQSVLGKSSGDLLALDQQRQTGTDITPALAALQLTSESFGQLVRICTLVNSNPNPPVFAGDWNEVYSILVQVKKLRMFETWRAEENAADLTLGPDYFELLPPKAAPTPRIYSTGMTEDGTPLSDGQVDPHWTITSIPTGSTTAHAYATLNSAPVGTAWIANSETSRWISPQSNQATGDPSGSYTYRATFDLTGFDPATVRIISKVAVDDAVQAVRLNGQSLGFTATGYAAFTPLTINSGFNANLNTLEFVISNGGSTVNPTGLRVEFAVTATLNATKARPWRASEQARQVWRSTLQSRIAQQQAILQAQRAAVDATEQATLPLLRDALVAAAPLGADQLTQRLLIDVRGSSYRMTTRVAQAIETIQSLFVALLDQTARSFSAARTWMLYDPQTVSNEWQWMGSYSGWQAAMRVFLWPENLLLPGLRHVSPDPVQPGESTQAFNNLVKRLRGYKQLTPDQARAEAVKWLADIGPKGGLPQTITELLDEAGLLALRAQIQSIFQQYSGPPIYLQEAYYFVPMQLALELQQAGQFEAALAWFRTIYAHDMPTVSERRIYYGLVVEGSTQTRYLRTAHWLLTGLDAHPIAKNSRANAYTCYTLMAIMRCLLDYADAEFTADTAESVARARTLYLTAQDLYAVLQGLLPTAPGIEANPIPPILSQHAAISLSKMRRGENIAGLQRQLRTFQNGQPAPAEMISVQPTPYRYALLIERAKHLVSLAQQIEGSYLAALEKTDAESYNIFKARQDLGLAEATVELQNRRVTEAHTGVIVAATQLQKSDMQASAYAGRLAAGLMSNYEKRQLDLLGNAAKMQYASAAMSGLASLFSFAGAYGPSGIGGALSTIASGMSSWAGGMSTEASILGTVGSYERRAADWQLQLDMANQDITIGMQQHLMALDHSSVVDQEQVISQLQAANAQATVDFLANKFTNAELYDWMSGILGRAYGYFLQQATAMARLAQSQLAFERQDKSLSVIQYDYWRAPSEGAASNGAGNPAPDRRGITGSVRLLQDIYELDQYAFETNRRKLQLTKTISLATLAPSEFETFRATGVMPFVTPMNLFDQDFPGHLLRLIRRIRVSVVALIPPTQGIRASLSSTGLSRVAVGDGALGFQRVIVRHDPEAIALSSPLNATGLFELDPQPELMVPFEGMGVDTSWEFQMPMAANRFDYGSIADVLVTIEYTAMDNFEYRQQVIRELDHHISAERPFSFRNRFADLWYDLHNPEQKKLEEQMVVRFTTAREDFPPNIENLTMAQIVLYVARQDGNSFSVPLEATLNFTPKGSTTAIGGTVGSQTGIYSTRTGSAENWKPILGTANNPTKPFGAWSLAFPNDQRTRDYFKKEEIEDILFVITYSGETPAWPL